MWSYYGRKTKLVKYYPKPLHDIIIEPFAGTATYSLYEDNWQKDVILVDKFHKIISIWHYLQQANPKDILNLPNIGYKEKIPTTLLDEERWLIGFCVSRGVPRPSTMGHKFNSWEKDKVKIAENLYKIKHWKIQLGSYEQLENKKATWFIDPPYQVGGYKYSYNKIDYDNLFRWVNHREGQIILCENDKNIWIPQSEFKVLSDLQGAFKKSVEGMYYIDDNKSDVNSNTIFINEQIKVSSEEISENLNVI